ncbi:hypothetical protein BKA81DRAFT_344898 [Phyllosticta paracitricarpa]
MSIQTVDVVTAAKAAKACVELGARARQALYIDRPQTRHPPPSLPPDRGKRGFYRASSGSVRWDDIYAAAGRALVKRGVIIYATVRRADDEMVKAMARGLNVGSESVVFKIGGQ